MVATSLLKQFESLGVLGKCFHLGCFYVFLNLDVYIISCFCGNVVYHQKSLHVIFYNQIHQRILQKSLFMRLALMDAPQSALSGPALEKQKEVVKKGKAAVDKLLIEAKKKFGQTYRQGG